ncbi:MAG TPA: fumarylacetoacetate hydrolase family protein [Gaiellales bacterium]|nr:fumarylacetoacetate hydrolase family protein [Gaiellales bacterium]
MKAVRFVDPGGDIKLGRLDGDTIMEAGPAGPRGFVPDAQGWQRIADASGIGHLIDDVRLLHPTEPGKLMAIGLNYRDHAEESELDIPAVPVVFAKWTTSLIGHHEPIVVPREETRPDYEGEVAVVLAHDVYRANEDQARAAVGGISAFHDVSGRRAQLETPLRQFTLGKSFDTFAPMGPCVASCDGMDLADIDISTRVNGEQRQSSNTRNLIFSVVELIVYLSKGMTLQAGDVIATGTPGGVGDSAQPPVYLTEGDVVEVTVAGVGTLSNPVTLEA